MKYQIQGKNIVVTEAIKNSIETKLSRLDKYFLSNEDIVCRAVVRSYNIGSKIEVTIFTPHMDFRAEVKNDDLYMGVDLVVEKLEGQIRKLKTRLQKKVDKKESLGESLAFENFDVVEEVKEEMFSLVRTKSIYLEPMSLEDAITRMEAIDHEFFLYLDEEDNSISVLYRREDGGYGILQSENEVK